MKTALYAAFSAIIFALSGCSSGNDSTTILDASGKHPSGWVVQANGGTHSEMYVSSPGRCVECHGIDLKGGVSKVSCFSSSFNGFTCHPGGPGHPIGWSAPDQHGAHAKAAPVGSGGMAFCTNCHGSGYDGAGNLNLSCFRCHLNSAPHPSPEHWRSSPPAVIPYTTSVTHTNTDTGNAPACSQCHNATAKNLAQPYLARFVPAGSFNGTAAGCFNGSMCHAEISKTTNCNVCHGTSTGAFNSLSGITTPANNKVGAHAKHLSSTISSPVACQECHPVPATYQLSGLHRNNTTNISFGPLATNNGALIPTVTGSYTCANVYCHGVMSDIGGQVFNPNFIATPTWNVPFPAGTVLQRCASCHGYPPQTVGEGSATLQPHTPENDCNQCHSEVNSTNDGFTPSGRPLHINGNVDATAGSAHNPVYPGSAHKAAGAVRADCSGCHDTTTAGGTYPATVPGAPPPCSGCHLNMTNFLGANPGCGDCHGASAADGRPNGSTFPNRQGKHNAGPHLGACTTCHPFTAGSTSHGWSNRTKTTNAQVNSGLTWVPGSRSNSGTCAKACHGTEESPWYP